MLFRSLEKEVHLLQTEIIALHDKANPYENDTLSNSENKDHTSHDNLKQGTLPAINETLRNTISGLKRKMTDMEMEMSASREEITILKERNKQLQFWCCQAKISYSIDEDSDAVDGNSILITSNAPLTNLMARQRENFEGNKREEEGGEANSKKSGKD